jgi:hypothetical protein
LSWAWNQCMSVEIWCKILSWASTQCMSVEFCLELETHVWVTSENLHPFSLFFLVKGASFFQKQL